MKKWMLILLVLAALAGAVPAAKKVFGHRGPAPEVPAPKRETGFDPGQSVALFVGARTFSEDSSLEMVPYAVDDAVDLAYTFALDPRVRLVYAKNIILALSDPTPRKQISQRRLAELKRQGAKVVPASQTQILKTLNQQAGAVRSKGMFIVSFASHGFSHDGTQYLLASNSYFREVDTAIPAARIFDLVAKSRAGRSLILIDTCRARVVKQRNGMPEILSAAPLIQKMGLIKGQVILYAAASGQWAYDDDLTQNGVFTGAVLDTLQCRAGPSGTITIDALAATVEERVLAWIRTNRDPEIGNATQVSIDGGARTMPLSTCSLAPPPEPSADLDDIALLAPSPFSSRTPLRQFLQHCEEDGKTLLTHYDSLYESLYDTDKTRQFVNTYLQWRDGCVSVLRELDNRLPPRDAKQTEAAQFLSVANSWCATKCPAGLSAGNCALFQENPRAERCFWDLDVSVKHIEDVIIRSAPVLQASDSAVGEHP